MKIVLTRALSCLLAFALALPIGGTAQSPGQAPPPQDGPAFSQEQLDQLLAPIALYPDPLLAQILMASTYPLEVVEAARWVQANPNVQDQALEDAMQQKSWDPSVKSLTALPEVLQMMNEKLEWTQQLGDAFLAQQEQVMATVQGLRAKAQAAGNLGSSTEQVVTSEQTGGTTIITVEPANPQIVYVPTYDPMVVYGAWPYPAYPPYYWYPPGYVAGGIISFGFGVAVGAALWGGCNWGHRNVYINNVNRYNSFNRTTISNNHWQHNVDHRRGVAYRDQRVAQQYNRGSATRDVQSREQFRGYSDQGRHTFQSGNFGQYRGDRTGAGGGAPIGGARPGAGTSDLGAGRGAGGAGGGRPSASTGAIGGGGRPSASTGAIGGGGRPSASTGAIGGGGAGTRDFGSASRGGGASAFDGVGRGTQTRGYSSRGNSSLGASRAGGGGGGGGAHTGGGGGGGGARTGGGGGGGGARSGGGAGRR